MTALAEATPQTRCLSAARRGPRTSCFCGGVPFGRWRSARAGR